MDDAALADRDLGRGAFERPRKRPGERALGLLAGAAKSGLAQPAFLVDEVDAEAARREQPLAAVEDLVEHRRVSATELLMTCSTSAVAVCCSSASFVSLNRRTFWIAITAWSAKVLSSSTRLSA